LPPDGPKAYTSDMVDSSSSGPPAPGTKDAPRPGASRPEFSSPQGAAVIIMAKAPRAGEAKTRLSPPLSPRECAALAACLFADVAAWAREIAPALCVAYAPAGGRAALEALLPEQSVSCWLEQRGHHLGERLAHATGALFARGFGPVAVIGTDSPTLPPEYPAEALSALGRGGADLALGPAEDGGYYLLALSRPAPGLFEGVEWSTPRAYEQTARNGARLSLRLAEMPGWYDVDTPADLLRLRRELFTDAAARRRAPATFRWLREAGALAHGPD
jgi:uncharacterized protein